MKVRDLLKVIRSVNDVLFKDLDPCIEFNKLMSEEFQDKEIKTLTATGNETIFVELKEIDTECDIPTL